MSSEISNIVHEHTRTHARTSVSPKRERGGLFPINDHREVSDEPASFTKADSVHWPPKAGNTSQDSCFRITIKRKYSWTKAGEFKDLSNPQKNNRLLSGVHGYYKPTRCNVIQRVYKHRVTYHFKDFCKIHFQCLFNFGLILLRCQN